MFDFFLEQTKRFFIGLSRFKKIIIIILIDIFICMSSIWGIQSLHYQKFIDFEWQKSELYILSIVLATLVFYFRGVYNVLIRHIGLQGIYNLFISCFIYAILFLLFIKLLDFEFSLNLIILQPIVLFTFATIFRLIIINFLLISFNFNNYTSIMIYGAGMAGQQIAYALAKDKKYNIKGFFDDDVSLQKLKIDIWQVYNPVNIKKIVVENNIKEILLAIPSLSIEQRQIILKRLQSLNIKIKTLPHFSEIVSNEVNKKNIHELNVLDLLPREEIKLDLDLIKNTTFQKTILITGAGGSIGSEISRQIISLDISVIILIDSSEVSLYKIDYELRNNTYNNQKNKDIKIISILASVCDFDQMNNIVKLWKPDIIYHTAAYKHVPLIENNISQGVINNIFGTKNIADIALENHVKNFVLISTDKAVRPTNIMGATKRVSELYIQALDNKTKKNKPNTIFSIVRFGNVLDSSGSVVPLFRNQIKLGGPITVTHRNVKRYFMTIPEASQLVIQTTSIARGGDVFVLGMGNLVKIYDLAVKMIVLSGLSILDKKNPNGDIKIKFIGLRPGEKMHEELLINKDFLKTDHPKIIKGMESFIPYNILIKKIRTLDMNVKNNDVLQVRKSLKKIVKEFSEVNEIKNIIYNKKLDIS